MRKQNRKLKLLISIVASLISWVLIDRLIVEISIWKYFIIELIIIGMRELYQWQLNKLEHEEKINTEP